MRLKKSEIILWFLVILLLILHFVRVEPNVVWSSETFMGIFVAFIGIAVTLIIGYQIYNAMDIKRELREMRKDVDEHTGSWKNEINTLKDHVETIHSSVREGIAILDALRLNDESSNLGRDLYAFAKMHESLLYSLDYNSPNYEFILSKLMEFGSRICTQSFGPGFAMTKDGFYYACPNDENYNKKLKDVVNEKILPPIKDIENQIKNHNNFTAISFTYKDIMRRFYKRIDIASDRFFPENLSEFENF